MMMNNPAIQIGENKVYSGHNLDILRTFDDNSIDSIVTDPPYELGFMSKSWDKSGIAYSVELWQECLRVLKPGGHLLAFGGSRTWHRLAVAIEDAGFEMRDSIAWLYGSGFPKSLNISKSIEAKITTGSGNKTAFKKLAGEQVERGNWGIAKQQQTHGQRATNYDETAGETRLGKLEATTPEAKQWDGWGTALKPAFEPIVVARKPLIGTVAENVLQFGVGGLNIDASRIGFAQDDKPSAGNRTATFGTQETISGGDGSGGYEAHNSGRWPANVILDETTAQLLDEQSGNVKGKMGVKHLSQFTFTAGGESKNNKFASQKGLGDSGGASRFFYVAKASKRDRNEGLDELPTNKVGSYSGNVDGHKLGANPNRADQIGKNFHPTVKPTTLMTYLIKLVTPEAGIVLDPFAGSGSTGKAAILEGYKFVGIELTADYLPIIQGRLQHAYQNYLDKGDDLFA